MFILQPDEFIKAPKVIEALFKIAGSERISFTLTTLRIVMVRKEAETRRFAAATTIRKDYQQNKIAAEPVQMIKRLPAFTPVR